MRSSQGIQLEGLRQPASYVRELESLRGWAILLVVLFHYVGILRLDKRQLVNENNSLAHTLAAGNTGVSLFFVLSGFLLARPFLHRIEMGSPLEIASFYRARALRIIPLYYLVVFLAWAVSGNSACAKALLFIPIGYDAYPFSMPWWSLSTEVQFYLVLPWFMLGISQPRWRAFTIAVVVLWLGSHITLLMTDTHSSLLPPKNSFPDRGCAFIAGIMAAWLFQSGTFPNLFPRVAINLTFCLAMITLLITMEWYGTRPQEKVLIEFPLFHYLEAFLWAAILFCVIHPKCSLKPLLCNRLFNFLGRISYSLYLLHLPFIFYIIYPAIKAVHATTAVDYWTILMVVASFVASIAAATLSYEVIERPFLRLKTKIRS